MSVRRRIKGILGSACFRSGLHRRAFRDRAVVAVFHRVDDRYRGNPITVPSQFFRDFCRFSAEHFHVVPFASLVDDLREGRPLGGQLAITFDDGYLDNHRTAAPILEAERLPCTFFIATGFIESNHVPWWDRNAGIASEWMTWKHVEDLHLRGFDIGGHTITHADLSVVEGAVAYQEIAGGKQELEARLAAPITVFSYPFGRAGQITEDNRRQVRDAGFHCCASAYGGTIGAGDDPFRLRRFPVSDWHLSVEQWGYEAAFGRWD